MSRLRHGNELRISFFAFQDIITAVTGILVLVTLMLTFSMHEDDGSNQELENRLKAAQERATEVEASNQKTQELRIEAQTLPDTLQVQAQIEALRREQEQTRQRRQSSEEAMRSARAQAAREQPLPELRQKVATLEIQIRALEAELKVERTNSNVLFVLPDAEAQATQKQPAALVVAGEQISAQRIGPGARREVVNASENSFRDLMGRFNAQEDLLVLYFRPSGAKWFQRFRELARGAGFEVGYDAVEENKELVFGNP